MGIVGKVWLGEGKEEWEDYVKGWVGVVLLMVVLGYWVGGGVEMKCEDEVGMGWNVLIGVLIGMMWG